jgi:hypothetical protein
MRISLHVAPEFLQLRSFHAEKRNLQKNIEDDGSPEA